jgi:hypothetical protein
MNWVHGVITILETISEILTAGIAILGFSILLYSFNFNLKDRVARSFALIIVCLVIIFSTESFSVKGTNANSIDTWLRIQWIGIILLPAAYLNFSDALLATTGLPSRWRRKWAIRVVYLISIGLILLLGSPWLLGPVVLNQPPAPHNEPTVLAEIFTVYYVLIMVLAWINFVRAFKRTITRTSKRRMFYLTLSAVGPAIGSFPFLLYGSNFAANQTLLFWLLAIITNTILGGFIVIMAYAVAFFGVPWPDRVVKSRLFKWLLRGPITASLTLALVTIVRRGGAVFGNPYNAFVPIVMVVTVVLFEYAITVFYPYVEKWFFYNKDEDDLLVLRNLEEKTITRGDLRQLSEMILAAVCDRLQASGAYLVAPTEEGLEIVVINGIQKLNNENIEDLEGFISSQPVTNEMMIWGQDGIIPLRNKLQKNGNEILGYLGISKFGKRISDDPDEEIALRTLAERAALVLRDRATQEQLFQMMERMNPQNELIQQLRVAGRFNRKGLLQVQTSMEKNELRQAVKDALTHYWGGPKLTENPLTTLQIVNNALSEGEQNPVNALRSVLKSAIETVRPEGERKFTGEWLLYNILELKFMEGKKVREIAMKLALSEADLYRKQRVAIDIISDTIVKMEIKASNKNEMD